MGIKQLCISNFQSHKETVLDLHPGVNILSGSSDCGKTAVIRALRWLVLNRPSGDAFRSRWGGDTEVKVVLDDGTEIVRSKIKRENTYRLNDKIYKALGTEVPESIVEKLNISSLSWQSQMDAPFLLSESSGEVSRVLNEIADLEKIDVATSNINRMFRDSQASFSALEVEIQDTETELTQYDNVDIQLKKIVHLKELSRRKSLIDLMLKNASNILVSFKQSTERLNSIPDYTRVEKLLQSVEENISAMEVKLEEIASGKEVLNENRRIKAQLAECALPNGIEDRVYDLLAKVQVLSATKEKVATMSRKLDNLVTKQLALHFSNGKLKEHELCLKKAFPAECPLCGQAVKK